MTPRERPPVVAMVLGFYGLLAALATAWLWLAGRPVGFAHGAAPSLLGLGFGLGVAAASRLAARRGWGHALAREFQTLLGPLSPGQIWLMALVSGSVEELAFRGALQPVLGLTASSLLFGLIHCGPNRTFLPWTGFAIAMGFALGLLYQTTGDLLAPVLAHVVINALNLELVQRVGSLDPDQGGHRIGQV